MLVVDRHKDRLPLSQCLNCVHVFPMGISAFSRFPALTARRPSTIPITNQTGERQPYSCHLHPALLGYFTCYQPLCHVLSLRYYLNHNHSFSFIVPVLHLSCRLSPHLSPFPPDKTCPANFVSRSSTPTVRIHNRLLLLYHPVLELRLRILSDGIDALYLG